MDLRDFTVFHVFKRNARCYRDRIALQSGDRKVTFAELHDQSLAVGGWLASRGIRRGDRIAVLTKNRPEFFPLLGGAAARGAILVPVNFRLAVEEIGHVLSDTRPELLFYEADFEPAVRDLRSRGLLPKETIVFGDSGQGEVSFAALLDHQPAEAAVVGDGDPLVIIHTAAIQGKPRGAVLSHRGLLSCSLQTLAALALSAEDVYLNILPLFHIGGLMAGLTVMQAGGKNVILSRFDPGVAASLIDREQVTLIGNFPPILTQLLDVRAAGGCSLASLKNVFGIELPETVKRFEALGTGRFWLIYGQTETMGLTCLCPNAEKPGSAGRPGLLADVKIVDEFDWECAPGKPGEILVRGPLVFDGYWEEAELTRQTARGGWHHTGDLGRVDEEGFLWFVGRKAEKELIKPGGENVYPAEVEKAIMEHPGVREVSVIGVPDPKFGEGIKAVCVLHPGIALTAQELIDFVAGRIARYKKPGYCEFVETLPKKEDGAIDRAKVKALYGVPAR